MSGKTELLPCPFCGGEAEVCEGGINGRMRVYGLIEHKDGCFFLADGLPTKYQHIMESEFDAWNARAERTCEMDEDIGATQTLLTCSECGYTTRDYSPIFCGGCGAKVKAVKR